MQRIGSPPLRHAPVTSVASRVTQVPAAPASLARLAVELSSGLFSAAATASGRSALAELRSALFTAHGHERAARALWHESLATAACAELLAHSNGAAVAVATLSGLLHRAGDACVLQALARDWQLSRPVADCVTAWHRCPELEAPTPEIAAVYCGHLLAVQLLQPELCAPGAIATAAAEHGFDVESLASLHGTGARIRALLRTL